MKSYLRIIVGGVVASLVGGATMYILLQAQPAAVITGTFSSEGGAIVAMEREVAQLRREMEQLRQGRPQWPDALDSGGAEGGLGQEVAELRALVGVLQDQQRRLDQQAAQGGADAALIEEDEWDVPRDHEEEMAEAREQVRQHFSTIESAYQGEKVDHAWRAAVVDRAYEAFANDHALSGVTLSEVDCRSSRCRLEIWFDGDDVDPDDVELALAENMAGETPSMAIHYLEDYGAGAGTAVVYLARKGYGLVPN